MPFVDDEQNRICILLQHLHVGAFISGHSEIDQKVRETNIFSFVVLLAGFHPLMTGLVKDRAWAYENEVRLRVNVQDYEEYEQIAVEVPEFVVQSITMMTGPRFTGNIEDITKAYNIQVNQSLFTNKLAWIPCDDCEDVKAKAE